MIEPSEGILTHTGLCWFAGQQIPPRLEAFAKEIDGVREAKDIENIHRMRVASRRLRAALPLFRQCFSKKKYLRWMQEITDITRALGEARDADVQIAFLQKQIKKSTSSWKTRNKDNLKGEPPEGPALRYLLAELQKKRSNLQSRVVSAINSLEKSRIIPEIQAFFTSSGNSHVRLPGKALMYGVPPIAALHIEFRLKMLLSYDAWVNHPEAVAEHHATRIAAKKLRYTMEIFGPVYRLGHNKPLSRVKMIQEILGDIHDCDVWIDHITLILLKERTRLRSDNEEKRPDTTTLASLKILLQERERDRAALYRHFTRFWDAQKRARLWDGLRKSLVSGRVRRYLPKDAFKEPEARSAVMTLASACPECLSHSTTVTNLALMLFDNLSPLHQRGKGERFLLECAAMLHDIGWMKGGKQHNRSGAVIICEAEILPFDLPERTIISLAVLAHRGRSPIENEDLFRLLLPEQQKTVRYLAAILRVADGFDYLRKGSVRELHCVIDKEQVSVDAIAIADISAEKDRARVKSDLFSRVFSVGMVIH
ncbi:CHAD domain-containing protein [Methanoregula sp.]|uniref:CHAD domain-containing protein n=1 Tax=Methanoregula sp. TaxID=2052170 RepID=UPI00356A46A7